MPAIKNGDPRNCAHCGASLERKRFNGRLEDFTRFLQRKFCDQKCMADAMLKEDPSRQAYAIRARKHLGPHCERCGTPMKRSIHHKDRDWRNNDPQNLSTLCASCHTSLHHAAGDISPQREKPPCKFCGNPSYRSGVCNTCRTRIRRHGDPFRGRNKSALSSKLRSQSRYTEAGPINSEPSATESSPSKQPLHLSSLLGAQESSEGVAA